VRDPHGKAAVAGGVEAAAADRTGHIRLDIHPRLMAHEVAPGLGGGAGQLSQRARLEAAVRRDGRCSCGNTRPSRALPAAPGAQHPLPYSQITSTERYGAPRTAGLHRW
jgi:hypothetical protein